MADTDTVKNTGQPKDAPASLRWAGWFIEKVGLPGAIIFAMFFGGRAELRDFRAELGAKMDRLVAAVEAKK